MNYRLRATAAPSASAAAGIASNIHRVNWADPRDNVQSGNIVPSSVAATDNYATTCNGGANQRWSRV